MRAFIESGILEVYVLGAATDAENRKVVEMIQAYPEVKVALGELEKDLELMAQHMAISPPPNAWRNIENQIDDLILNPDKQANRYDNYQKEGFKNFDPREQYIEVEVADSYMKLHKGWKWVFVAVFVLAKIFLGCAIYFYLENRQAQQQLKELKSEARAHPY